MGKIGGSDQATFSLTANTNVNIIGQEKIDQLRKSLSEVVKLVNTIGGGSNLMPYLKDDVALIDRLKTSVQAFQRQANSVNAGEIIKISNSLRSIGGFDNNKLESIIPSFDKIRSKAVEMAGATADAFSMEKFANARNALKLLAEAQKEAAGTDLQFSVDELYKSLMKLGENTGVENFKTEIRGLTREVSYLNNELESAYSEIDRLKNSDVGQLKSELTETKTKMTRELESFLVSNKVLSTDDIVNGDYKGYYSFFESIINGSKTSAEAIADFKNEFGYLLEDGQINGKLEQINSSFEVLRSAIETLNTSLNGSRIVDSLEQITQSLQDLSSVVSQINDKDFNIQNVFSVGSNKVQEVKNLRSEAIELVKIVDKMSVAVADLSKQNPDIFRAALGNSGQRAKYVESMYEYVDAAEQIGKINKAGSTNLSGTISTYEELRQVLTKIIDEANKLSDQKISLPDTSAYDKIVERKQQQLSIEENIANAAKEALGMQQQAVAKSANTVELNATSINELGQISSTVFDDIRKKIESTFDLSTVDMHQNSIVEKINEVSRALNSIDAKKLSSASALSYGGNLIEKDTNAYWSSVKQIETLRGGITSSLVSGRPASGDASYQTLQDLSAILDNLTAKLESGKLSREEFADSIAKIGAIAKTAQNDLKEITDEIKREQQEMQEAANWEKMVLRESSDAQSAADKAEAEYNKREAEQEKAAEAAERAAEREIQAYANAAEKAAQAAEKAAERKAQAAEKAAAREAEANKKITMDSDPNVALKMESQIVSAQSAIKEALRGLNGAENQEFVKTLNEMNAALEEMRTKLSGEGMQKDAFSREMTSIGTKIKEATQAAKDYKKAQADAAKNSPLTAGTKEFASAQSKANKLLEDATRRIQSYSGASRGAAKESYEALKESQKQIEQLVSDLASGKVTEEEFTTRYNTLASSVAQSSAAIRGAGRDVQSLGDRFKNVAKRFSVYFSATRIIMTLIRGVKDLVKTAIELDSAMGDLRIVTNETNEAYERYGQNIAKVAEEISASTVDLINATTTFARLGYNLDESSALAKYTGMLQQVGDIEAQDAQDAITAIIKAFSNEIDISNIESVMDKLVAVGNNFPISVSQIAEGMNNASSTLAAAGNSFEQSVALLTAANVTVQNAAKASTGLRTIAARIRNTTSELDDLGESIETAKYEEAVKMLTNYKVALTNANGEYRSTYDIMRDIADAWGEMTSMEQAAIATQLAGTRQQAIFYSIIEQFREASGAMDAMSNSAGTLTESYQKYQDTIQGHINSLKAAWAGFAQEFVSSTTAKKVVDIGKSLIGVLGTLAKIFDSLGGIYHLVGVGIFAAFSKITPYISSFIGGIRSGFENAVLTGGKLPGVLDSVSNGFKNIGVSADAAKIKVAAIITLITMAYALQKNLEAKYEERISKTKEEVSRIESETQQLHKLTLEYYKLKSSGEDVSYVSGEINSILEANKDILGEQVDKVDLQNGKLEEQYQLLKDINQERLNGLEASATDRAAEEAALSEYTKPRGPSQPFAKLTTHGDWWDKFLNFIQPVYNYIQSGSDLKVTDPEPWTAKEYLDYYTKRLEDMLDGNGSWFENTFKNRYIQLYTDLIKQYGDIVSAAEDAAVQVARRELPEYIESFIPEGFEANKESIEELIDYIVEYSAQTGYRGTSQEFIDAAITGALSLENLKGVIYDIISLRFPDYVSSTSQEVKKVFTDTELKAGRALSKLSDIASGLKSNYDLVKKAEEEMLSDGLSAETIKSLADINEKYLDYLYEENGVIKLNTDAWREYIDEAQKSDIETLKARNILLSQSNDGLKNSIAALSTLSTRNNLAEGIASLNAEIEQNNAEIQENTEKIKLYEAAYNQAVQTLGNATTKLSPVLSALKSSYETLKTARDEMLTGSISIDTIASLESENKKYADYLYMENGALKLNLEAWQEYINLKYNTIVGELKTRNEELNEENANLLANMKEVSERAGADTVSALTVLSEKYKENTAEIAKNAETLEHYEAVLSDVTQNISAISPFDEVAAGFGTVRTAVEDVISVIEKMDVKSVVEDTTSALRTLADIQKSVSESFTISRDKAIEYATVYPEILNGATVAADGQITLNQAVVNDLIAGKQVEQKAVIDAKIADLEADKVVYENKRNLATAQLELAQGVLNGEIKMSEEEAIFRINASKEAAESLIEHDAATADAFQLVIAAMNGDLETFNKVVAAVAESLGVSMDDALVLTAETFYTNMNSSKQSINDVIEQAHQLALAISGAANGEVRGTAKKEGTSLGSIGGGISVAQRSGGFSNRRDQYIQTVDGEVQQAKSELEKGVADGLKNISESLRNPTELENIAESLKLELDGYNEAIANIDGQIAVLRSIQSTPLAHFASDYGKDTGKSKSDSGSSKDNDKEDAEEMDDYFKRMYAWYNHLVEMNQETYGKYINWLNDAYKEAYETGEITIDEFYRYEEEVLKGLEKIQEDAKKAIDDLVDYREKMLRKDYEDQKNALKKQLDELEDFYNKQKELLRDQKEEETYLKDQGEKRKSVTDIQAEIARLQNDDSAWAKKRILELSSDLIEAQESLAEFEKDHAYELAEEALETAYNEQESNIQSLIDEIDKILDDPNALHNQALADINGNLGESGALYGEMVEFAKANGEDINSVKTMWETAYKSLANYNTTKELGDALGVSAISSDMIAYLSSLDLANATNYKTDAVTTPEPQRKVTTTSTTKTTGTGSSGSSGSAGGGSTSATKSKSTGSSGSTSTGKTSTSPAANRTPKVGDSANVSGLAYSTVKGTGNSVDITGRKVVVSQIWDNAANPYWQGDYIYLVSDANAGYAIGWVKLSQLSGYASGTRNAVPGLHAVDELGPETLFTSKNGNHYRILHGGDKVLDANATKFLYEFATQGSRIFGSLTAGGSNVISKILGGASTPIINMGDIIINGNTDEKTVSEIRREQRNAVEFMLKSFNRLQT